MLLERGYVSDESLQQAIGRHAEVGGRLAEILVDIGVISEQRIARAIEESLGIPLVSLPRVEVTADALSKVNADLAYELGAIPFGLDGTRLRVAFEDPLDALAIEEIEDASGTVVEPYQALQKELHWAIATYYPELGLEPPADLDLHSEERLGNAALERGLIDEEQLRAATEEEQRTGGQLARILVDQGALGDRQVAQLQAELLDLPYLDDLTGPDVQDGLSHTLLRLDAVQFTAVPVRDEGDHLLVAIADPRRMPEIEAVTRRVT